MDAVLRPDAAKPPQTIRRRTMGLWVAIGPVLALAGCAGMQSLTADVSTFGEWPAGRAPGSFAFDRLPSQLARADEQQPLEAAATAALMKAGFVPAAAGRDPDVLVQVGVRVTRQQRSPWDDPLWWHGGFGAWRQGPWRGPAWSFSLRADMPRYDREIGLLLRDRASSKPLFEARASHWGVGAETDRMLPALFLAALVDFPRTGLNPRPVTVTIQP
ncbi:MAG: DUF4136 domain-containing protein [Aquabacterium sp.]